MKNRFRNNLKKANGDVGARTRVRLADTCTEKIFRIYFFKTSLFCAPEEEYFYTALAWLPSAHAFNNVGPLIRRKTLGVLRGKGTTPPGVCMSVCKQTKRVI